MNGFDGDKDNWQWPDDGDFDIKDAADSRYFDELASYQQYDHPPTEARWTGRSVPVECIMDVSLPVTSGSRKDDFYSLAASIINGSLYSWGNLKLLDTRYCRFVTVGLIPEYDYAYLTAMIMGCYVLTENGVLVDEKGRTFAEAFAGFNQIEELFDRCEPYFGYSCGFFYLKGLWYFLTGADSLALHAFTVARGYFRADFMVFKCYERYTEQQNRAMKKLKEQKLVFPQSFGATPEVCSRLFTLANSLMPDIAAAASTPSGQCLTRHDLVSSFDELVKPDVKACINAAAAGGFSNSRTPVAKGTPAARASKIMLSLQQHLNQWLAQFCPFVQMHQVSGSFVSGGQAASTRLDSPVCFKLLPWKPGTPLTVLNEPFADNRIDSIENEVVTENQSLSWSNALRLVIARRFAHIVNAALSDVITLQVSDDDFADKEVSKAVAPEGMLRCSFEQYEQFKTKNTRLEQKVKVPARSRPESALPETSYNYLYLERCGPQYNRHNYHKRNSDVSFYGRLPGAQDVIKAAGKRETDLYRIIAWYELHGQFHRIAVSQESLNEYQMLYDSNPGARVSLLRAVYWDLPEIASRYPDAPTVREAITKCLKVRQYEEEAQKSCPFGTLNDGEMPFCSPDFSLYAMVRYFCDQGKYDEIDPDRQSIAALLEDERYLENDALIYDIPEYDIKIRGFGSRTVRELVRKFRVNDGTQNQGCGDLDQRVKVRDRGMSYDNMTLPVTRYPGAPYVLSMHEELQWRTSGNALALKDGRRVYSDAAVMDWLNMLILRYHSWRLNFPEDVMCPRRINPRAWSSPLAAALQIEAMSSLLPVDSAQLLYILHPYHQQIAWQAGLSLHYVVIEFNQPLADDSCLTPGMAIKSSTAGKAASKAAGKTDGKTVGKTGRMVLPDELLMLIRALQSDLPAQSLDYDSASPARAASGKTTDSKDGTAGTAAARSTGAAGAGKAGHDCRAAAIDLRFNRPVTASERNTLGEVNSNSSHDLSALYLGWTQTDRSLIVDFLVYDYDSFSYIADQWSRLGRLDSLNIKRITMCALSGCATPHFLYGPEAGRLSNSAPACDPNAYSAADAADSSMGHDPLSPAGRDDSSAASGAASGSAADSGRSSGRLSLRPRSGGNTGLVGIAGIGSWREDDRDRKAAASGKVRSRTASASESSSSMASPVGAAKSGTRQGRTGRSEDASGISGGLNAAASSSRHSKDYPATAGSHTAARASAAGAGAGSLSGIAFWADTLASACGADMADSPDSACATASSTASSPASAGDMPSAEDLLNMSFDLTPVVHTDYEAMGLFDSPAAASAPGTDAPASASKTAATARSNATGRAASASADKTGTAASAADTGAAPSGTRSRSGKRTTSSARTARTVRTARTKATAASDAADTD